MTVFVITMISCVAFSPSYHWHFVFNTNLLQWKQTFAEKYFERFFGRLLKKESKLQKN